MFSASAAFRDAYAATTYRFGAVGLRIGRRQGVDRLLGRLRCRRASVLTAWDPFSVERGAAANRAAQARLRRHLPRAMSGCGVPDDTGKRGEAMLLAPRIAPRAAALLARRFRQNAMVLLRRGAAPALVLLR
ncbi:DUF3293 domain-containing protein [Pseudoroseomonas cervicalis]|uniref:DUF3293 domain-containing protein n=1 Tax=Teichococcus cervicalis TaxID=204525 RepID=UPI0022F15FD2|nr:DUF3293 domain-containing protein [Pseudoroseomonas cervicalis]WBV42794.1 DUF3293 domain-containing protein [Pseudoroseomonas cervicalis]